MMAFDLVLEKLQFLSLREPDIDQIHCLSVYLPLLLVDSQLGLGQVELFLLVNMHCHRVHGGKEYRLSFPAEY